MNLTSIALRYLSRQLRRDAGYRESWKANIAMVVHDCTRGNHPTMAKIEGGGVAVFARFVPIEQCNYLADRILKHCFDV